ncbi:hypothetical protein, partial [Marinoscillum sp. MHG1-6]|uniref:hypothetical protein n=1 Tax=Marinoscillum sp. MHG1-6 TaxID=2959627 RepID=UPI002157F021
WATAADPSTQIDDDAVLDDDINGNTGVVDDSYVLIITNLVTGCTSTTINVTIAPGQPTLAAGTSGLTGNSVCDPDLNDPSNPDANGAITFTPTGGTTYAFALETSGGTPIDATGLTAGFEDVAYDIDGVTTTTVSGLPVGNFIMTITDETSGCSIDEPFTIAPATTDPAALSGDIATADNVSCIDGQYTGTATVELADITDGAVYALTDYSFFWATADDPTTLIDDDEVLDDDINGNSGVEDGSYVLVITNTVTGCTSSTINVTINPGLPSITPTPVVIQDNFTCDVDNPIGSATLTIAEGPNSDYTFAWYKGTSAAGTVISTNDSIADKIHGTYTILITDNTSGCTNTAQVVIEEFAPTMNVTVSSGNDQTACYPSNGIAQVDNVTYTYSPAGPPDGVNPDLQYTWYYGSAAVAGKELQEGVDPGNLSDPTNVDTDVVSGLSAGNYTVVVTDNQTGCVSDIKTVTVPDEVSPYIPDITFTPIQPTSCVTDNGSIYAEITTLNTGGANNQGEDFSFEWYEGAQDYATLLLTGADEVLLTGDELASNPGGATVAVTSNPGGLGANTTLSNLVAGLYTLVMIDNNTSCRYFKYYDLGYLGQQTTTTLTTDHVDACPDNGSATVGLSDDTANPGFIAGDVDDIAEYIIYLYAGDGVPADRLVAYDYQGLSFPYTYNPSNGEIRDGDGTLITTSAILTAGDEAVFSEMLPAGPYIAVARENSPTTFGSNDNCWTAASLDQEILDLAYEPIIQSNSKTANTNCDVTNGNGQLSVTIIEDPDENVNGGLAQPNGYRFTWIKDSDLSTVLTEDILTETATSTTPATLSPGSYTVTIGRLGGAGNTPNDCEVSTTLIVGNNPEQHEIADATITDNEDCSPLDGAVSISDAQITDNVADYFFTWYTTYIDEGNPGNVLLGDAFVDGGNNGDQGVGSISGLTTGNYYVVAEHATKTCVTPVFLAEVEDLIVNPTFNVEATAQDVSCDDVAPTGEATVTITNGSMVATDYTIDWF